MKKSFDAWSSVIITILAFAYPFCLRAADDYASRTFIVWPNLLVPTVFPLVMAFFVVIVVRGTEKSLLVHLLFVIVNLALGYYLFWYNSYTFGSLPVYQIFSAALMLFDWCIWRLKKDR